MYCVGALANYTIYITLCYLTATQNFDFMARLKPRKPRVIPVKRGGTRL